MVDIKTRLAPERAATPPPNALPDRVAFGVERASGAARHDFGEEDLRQAIELLFFAYRDMTAGPDAMLAKMGLGRAHHRLIHFVGRNPGIAVAELLAILRISKQSFGRVLREAVTRRLVMQRLDKDDKRRRLLYLTFTGTSLEEMLSAVQQERIAQAFEAIGPEAVAGWRTALWALVDDADRDRLQHAQTRRRAYDEETASRAKAVRSLETAYRAHPGRGGE